MHAWQRSAIRRRGVFMLVALGAVGISLPNFAATAQTAPTPRPAPPSPTQTGMYLSVCAMSHRSTNDPIVHHGMNGMSHSHDFFGNSTTNADSTAASLKGQITSCYIVGDAAAYWAPTLYANGKPISPLTSLNYYRTYSTGSIAPMPIGLKIVAGGRDHVRWSCFAHAMATALSPFPRRCPAGQQVSLGVNFPECWNGKTLDSADHMSHMAYATDHVCPKAYPTMVPKLTIWIMYRTIPDGATLSLSSGGIETAHADFFSAWDGTVQQQLHDYCLNGHRICYKTMYLILKQLGIARNVAMSTNTLSSIDVNEPGPDPMG